MEIGPSKKHLMAVQSAYAIAGVRTVLYIAELGTLTLIDLRDVVAIHYLQKGFSGHVEVICRISPQLHGVQTRVGRAEVLPSIGSNRRQSKRRNCREYGLRRCASPIAFAAWFLGAYTLVPPLLPVLPRC